MMTQTAGPSYRHLVDLSSPDQNSLFLNPLGQSGDMFNFLYDNFINDIILNSVSGIKDHFGNSTLKLLDDSN